MFTPATCYVRAIPDRSRCTKTSGQDNLDPCSRPSIGKENSLDVIDFSRNPKATLSDRD